MGRTFTALDLVRLPRLDASGAQTLATKVLSAGKKATMPANVKEAYDEVGSTLRVLNAAATHRLPAADPTVAREADVRIDANWSGIYYWLIGWSKVTELPEATVAASLRDQLFPDGLRFTQLAFRAEWAESNTRLLLIKERKLDASFDQLGGSKLLKSVRAAHKAYGEALGVTNADQVEEEAIAVRDALDDLTEALRNYVLQVSAMVRKKNAKSATLAQKLLKPITDWETAAAKSASEDDGTGDGGAGGDGTGADNTGIDATSNVIAKQPAPPAPAPAKKPEPVG